MASLFAAKKIVKEKGAEPEAFELEVGQALCDLEANSNDLKAELRELYIVSAKEVDVTGRKAVVIFVPFKLLKVVHKIQSRLVREVCAMPRRPPPAARRLSVDRTAARRTTLVRAANTDTDQPPTALQWLDEQRADASMQACMASLLLSFG